MLCKTRRSMPLEPCGRCESCRLFAAGSHPDLDVVGLPKDKSTLPLELFIGDKEHRNQDGLCHRIAFRPFFGGRKVAIIDDADRFSQESANCLLKTLEEPPPRSLMILIGTSPSKQLPTIRSRSQVVRFQPLERRDSRRDPAPTGVADRHRTVCPLGSLWRGERRASPRDQRSGPLAISSPTAARSVVCGTQSRAPGQSDSDVRRRCRQRGLRAARAIADRRRVRRGILSRPDASRSGQRRRRRRLALASLAKAADNLAGRPRIGALDA